MQPKACCRTANRPRISAMLPVTLSSFLWSGLLLWKSAYR